jgi:thiol-disulfide isomerase/thioredoxin
MSPLQPGADAPAIPGADRAEGPRAVMFYKVTCPTCQMAAPIAERFHQDFPERFLGVGQDPREKLDQFAEELGTSFPSVSDETPYEASNAYAIRTVPTVVLLDDGKVMDVVESWDRDGWNRLAAKMGGLTGTDPEALSWEGDGLPPFRPG